MGTGFWWLTIRMRWSVVTLASSLVLAASCGGQSLTHEGDAGDAGDPEGGSAGRGTGGSSVGGSTGVGGTPFCIDPDVTSGDPTGNSLRAMTTGVNGSFTDSCNLAGELLEHSCEIQGCGAPEEGDAAPTPPSGGSSGIGVPCSQATGQVTEEVVSCGPRYYCTGGACAVWCAIPGDRLAVFVVSSVGVSLSHSTERLLDCTATAKVGAADCDSEAISGHVMSVTSVSECDSRHMTFTVDDLTTMSGPDCTYSCTVRIG